MNERKKSQKWNRVGSELSVQMNRTAALTIKGKTVHFRPMRLLVCLLAGLLALVILVNLLLIPIHRPRTVAMDFETGGTYTMLPFGENLLMYNKQHLFEVNTKGKKLWLVDVGMSHPIVETAKQYVLIADLGGNNQAVLYKNGKKIREYVLGNDIISAKVNQEGWAVFATATAGYKGKITVFDKKGKERFSWNSGEGYIQDVALNDSSNRLAVAQLSSEGTQSDSRVQLIDLRSKKVTATAERSGTIITELRFSGNRLLSVSDSELCGFKPSGKLAFSVSFAGKNPGKYDISGDELLAFVTTDNRGNAVLELYNTKGKLKGQYRAESDINSLCVAEDMVVIARQREVLYINHRGKLKKTANAGYNIKGLGLYGDGHTALAAGNTEAYIVRMR